jgi:HD superfamily phosphohydrolase
MEELKFVNYILDNVHGYIGLTEVEDEIERLPVFQRLRRVKQLGLASLIFPGAEHTRYIHSLGVMHIIDQMAIKLGFTKKDRQLVRLAGMLHDIGHYPLSHTGELAYKTAGHQNIIVYDCETLPIDQNLKVKEIIDAIGINSDKAIDNILMEDSKNQFHHEKIGALVLQNSEKIKAIIGKYYDIDIHDICDIITGNLRKIELAPMIQLLHSELDADRIDYLLRDASFSGASYGRFELGTLVKNLAIKRHSTYGVDIVGVTPKGIGSADQFLVNRYLAYSQVIFQKHVAVLGRIAKDVMAYLLCSELTNFPKAHTLLSWAIKHEKNPRFHEFTDDFFINIILKGDKGINSNQIKKMLMYLSDFLAPSLKAGPIQVSSRDMLFLRQKLQDNDIYRSIESQKENDIFILDSVTITEHVPLNEFKVIFDDWCTRYNLGDHSDRTSAPDLEECLKHRLINGIAVIWPDKDPELLIDTECSLARDLSRHTQYFLSQYTLM